MQERHPNKAGRNGQYKRKGKASIYSHGGIANIRTWLEALQAALCFDKTNRTHESNTETPLSYRFPQTC